MTSAHLSPAVRRWVVALLLLAGVQVWLVFARGFWGRNFHWFIVAGVLVLAAIPWFNRRFVRIVDSLRHPSDRHRWLIAIAVTLVSLAYFILTAHLQHRDLAPIFGDDYSYLMQMRMLASAGRLWMPQHPLADFFEATHMLVRPVYTSIYFPGTAILLAPAIWLDLPVWVLPCVISGIVVGLTYRVTAEAVDGLAGLLVALMLAALPWYRGVGMLVGSRIPLMLFGLIAVWAWMRWRRSGRLTWAIVIGAAIGWAAITRPLDALCFAIPIGTAMLLRKPFRPWPLLVIVASALPFLGIQILVNVHVTGQWNKTPFTLYAQREYPGTAYGFHDFDASARPASALPQKQRSFDAWVVPFLKTHRPGQLLTTWMNDRFPMIAQVTLPHPLLWLLVPVGLLGVNTPRRWVIFAAAPLFVIGYAFYAFFLQPYALMIAPAIALCVALSADALGAAWPRAASVTLTFVVLAIVSLSIAQLPELNRTTRDQEWGNPLRTFNQAVTQLERGGPPSIVLIDGSHPNAPNLMATYNIDVAWPDDARVIRANDLGPQRNIELFRYYASRSPRRTVYRYDLHANELHRIGWADELLPAAGQ